ncbi:hypothetical protein [Coleofasciculus sp. H7-2]|uniref:hypothetical protein n=1 Tax=Coleofasciculus sp. H7-2 TaxID=3351545 RepID=UPI003673567E
MSVRSFTVNPSQLYQQRLLRLKEAGATGGCDRALRRPVGSRLTRALEGQESSVEGK